MVTMQRLPLGKGNSDSGARTVGHRDHAEPGER